MNSYASKRIFRYHQQEFRKIINLPKQLKKSFTWDLGMELAQHILFTIDIGIKVYFCDPKSPWQKGANENTNKLLRQYMLKRLIYLFIHRINSI